MSSSQERNLFVIYANQKQNEKPFMYAKDNPADYTYEKLKPKIDAGDLSSYFYGYSLQDAQNYVDRKEATHPMYTNEWKERRTSYETDEEINKQYYVLAEINRRMQVYLSKKQLGQDEMVTLNGVYKEQQEQTSKMFDQKERQIAILNGVVRGKPAVINAEKRLHEDIVDLQKVIQLKDDELNRLTTQIVDIRTKQTFQVEELMQFERKRYLYELTCAELASSAEKDDLRKNNQEMKIFIDKQSNELKQLKKEFDQQKEDFKVKESLLKQLNKIETKKLLAEEYHVFSDKTNEIKPAEEEKKKPEEKKEQVQTQKEKQKAGFQIDTLLPDVNLLDSVLNLVHYIRESMVDFFFEIYIKSQNIAFQKSEKSLSIFLININEIGERNIRGSLISLYIYKKIREIAKIYAPKYGKVSNQDKQQLNTALGKKQDVNAEISQSEINVWVQKQLKKIQQKRKKELQDPNSDYFYVFRLFSLIYRLRYPYQGDPFKVSLDLQVRLENKVCSGLLRIYVQYDLIKEGILRRQNYEQDLLENGDHQNPNEIEQQQQQ